MVSACLYKDSNFEMTTRVLCFVSLSMYETNLFSSAQKDTGSVVQNEVLTTSRPFKMPLRSLNGTMGILSFANVILES